MHFIITRLDNPRNKFVFLKSLVKSATTEGFFAICFLIYHRTLARSTFQPYLSISKLKEEWISITSVLDVQETSEKYDKIY